MWSSTSKPTRIHFSIIWKQHPLGLNMFNLFCKKCCILTILMYFSVSRLFPQFHLGTEKIQTWTWELRKTFQCISLRKYQCLPLKENMLHVLHRWSNTMRNKLFVWKLTFPSCWLLIKLLISYLKGAVRRRFNLDVDYQFILRLIWKYF